MLDNNADVWGHAVKQDLKLSPHFNTPLQRHSVSYTVTFVIINQEQITDKNI